MASPSGRVEFFLSCSDLTAKHAFACVYMRDPVTTKWLELGRTEVSFNSNPKFCKQFIVDFIFEEQQQLRFDIYKSANHTNAPISKNVIGSAAFKLSEVIHAKRKMLTRTLTKGRKVVKNRSTKRYARLNIRAERYEDKFEDNTSMKFTAKHIPKQGAFSKANCILEFHRTGEDGKCFKVYETEIIKKNLNPSWNEFTITSSRLCNNDPLRILQLKIFHCDKDQRTYICKTRVTYKQLTEDPMKQYDLKNNKGKVLSSKLIAENIKILSRKQNEYNDNVQQPQSNQYANANNGNNGNMGVPNMSHQPSAQALQIEQSMQKEAIRKLQLQKSLRSKGKFLSYLEANCEISLMVAIDFTGSNGYVSDPQSLHYIYKPHTPSPYQSALRQICSIVAYYDSDQKFPVWGFGAKFPGKDQVIHDFPLSPNGEEVDGVSGIEQSYITAIQSNAFQLAGPCCYSPILTKAINEAIISHNEVIKNPHIPLQYYILLILTNGQCCQPDKQQTKNLLIYASNNNLPLSIIFVGIGDNNTDFTFLEELDGDFDPVRDNNGQVAKRDIVQFVAMRDFINKQKVELSRYTLREIPIQFVSYVENNHLKPRKDKPKLTKSASKWHIEDEQDEYGYSHTKGNSIFNVSSTDFDDDDDDGDDDKEGDMPAVSPSASASASASDPMANVPVPIGWEVSYTANGKPFYINHKTRSTQWHHPLKNKMNIKKPDKNLLDKQKKAQAAYNVQLMNSSASNVFNPNQQQQPKFQQIKRTNTYQVINTQPLQQQSVVQRSATAAIPQQQSYIQRSATAAIPQQQYGKPNVVYAKPNVYAPQQQQQYVQKPNVYGQQQKVVYAQQKPVVYAQQKPNVVYAQKPVQQQVYAQQPVQQQQQRIAYDQYGRQIILPQQQQQQRVVYAQSQYGQQPVYQQQQQPQQRVVYQQQPNQQVVYQQQPNQQYRKHY